MMNTKLIGALLGVIVVAGAAFYGGSLYAKQSPARTGFAGQFANTSGMMGGRNGRGMGGFTAGEILSKDATSVTIKMPDGSTKIALLASSTQVLKTATGNVEDLSIGTNVVVTGSANSDGSVTAQSIQIRPAGFSGSRGTQAQ